MSGEIRKRRESAARERASRIAQHGPGRSLEPARFAALASLLALCLAGPALADGGKGGGGIMSGDGGTLASPDGGDGAGSSGGGGGGPGGGQGGLGGDDGATHGGDGGDGGTHGFAGIFGGLPGGNLLGTDGEAGHNVVSGGPAGGGGGGAGGYGALLSGSGQATIASGRFVSGGNGGAGGHGAVGGDSGGHGGDGGVGASLGGGELTNHGTIRGGHGGDGGDGTFRGGGGDGGAGVVLQNGSLVNRGTIEGGDGGRLGIGSPPGGVTASDGSGGAGILAGPNVTIVNSGRIAGGFDGGGGPRVNAITFDGGVNRLELQSGSTIEGLVVATVGSDDTLAVGGEGDGTFDLSSIGDTAQYRGFEHFETAGSGTWTLTGSTAAAISWRLRGGALSISSDDQLGAGTLTFDGGTLRVVGTDFTSTGRPIVWGAGGGGFDIADPTNTFTLDAVLSGPGGLTKLGPGTLTLNGANSFTGETRIEAGRLIVGDASHGGASLAGPVTVLGGAMLGGIGTVGTTAISTGGTVAPGNSIGTLTIDGDYRQEAGSLYEVEIEPGGSSDRIEVTGQAAIEGGTVFALKAPGTYEAGTRFTILSAAGGVVGTYEALDQNAPFVDLALAYDPGNVYLDVARNEVAFCEVAATRNQCATAEGAESTGAGNPLYDAIAGLPDADAARASFDALSGEIHASLKSALIESSAHIRNAANDRIRAAFEGVGASAAPVVAYAANGPVLAPASHDRGFVGWASAFGSWGSIDGDGNAAKLEQDSGGLVLGGDVPLGDWRLGLLAGYSRSSFDLDGRSSSGSSDNYHVGLYGGTQWGALGLRTAAAFSWHELETSRSVSFPGFADSLSADYDASSVQLSAELGYRIDLAPASVEPFFNFAYVHLHTDDFTEEGGAAALTSERSNSDVPYTTLGLRADTGFGLGGMPARLRGSLGWRHAHDDVTPLSTHAFAGADAFTVEGVPIAEDAAVIEAGLAVELTDGATFGLAYQGQFGSGVQQSGFNAILAVRF